MRFTAAVIAFCVLFVCLVSGNRIESAKQFGSGLKKLKGATKVSDVKVLHPFDRHMVLKNHVETVTFDDADCQTAVCEAVDSYYALYYETFKEFGVGSLSSFYAQCYVDCMGAYYGCSGSVASGCSDLNVTQSSCESEGIVDDNDQVAISSISNSQNITDDWIDPVPIDGVDDETTDESDESDHFWIDDDFFSSSFCEESDYYDIMASTINVYSTCGEGTVTLPPFNLNASDLISVNNLCTMNSNSDFCMDLVTESNAIYYSVVDCSYFYSYEASEDVCSIISDWGCCTGTLSMMLLPCVNQYLVDECGADLTSRCSKGMFESVTAVTTTITTDSYADLTQNDVCDDYTQAVADGASADGAAVDASYVSFNGWSGTTSRKLRASDKRRLAASTTMDVSINIVGDIVNTNDLVDTVDSSAFNTAFESVTGSTVSSKTAAGTETTDAEQLTFDDLAFSPTTNMALVFGTMFVVLALF